MICRAFRSHHGNPTGYLGNGGDSGGLLWFITRFAAAGTWGALVVFLMLELGWELQQISQAVFSFRHSHMCTGLFE